MALDGWVDGVFGNYIGVGFLSLFLAVLVSGAAAGFLARWSHCRSPAFLVQAGLVVVTLGYGVNWAVFLSSQPELGDHGVLTFLLNPMNAYTGLAHMLTTEKLCLVWLDTPGRIAGHWVAAGVSGMAGTRRTLGGAKCIEPEVLFRETAMLRNQRRADTF